MTTSVTYWDNDRTGFIRHRAIEQAPSTGPGFWEVVTLQLKQISLESARSKQTLLRNADAVRLWTLFLIRWTVDYYLPVYFVPAVAKVGEEIWHVIIVIVISVRKEEMHRDIRRIATTVMYGVGTLTVVAIAPKLVMVVWSL